VLFACIVSIEVDQILTDDRRCPLGSSRRDFCGALLFPHPKGACGIPQAPIVFRCGSLEFSKNLSLKWLCEHAGGGCNVTRPNPPPNGLADGPRERQYTPAQPTSRRGVGKKSDRRHLLQSPHFFGFFWLTIYTLLFCSFFLRCRPDELARFVSRKVVKTCNLSQEILACLLSFFP